MRLLRLFGALGLLLPAAAHAAPIHTSYLWHLHQPVYWPDASTWNPGRYETAYETITLGHSLNDEFSIFDSDDRVQDYQGYPKVAIESVLDLPDAGAQVSFAGSLIENVRSLANAGWNGGRYASGWYQPFRDAMSWTTSGGRRRLDPVIVGAHHAVNPLCDDAVFRRELQVQKALWPGAWGSPTLSQGFFPAEMCFSERLIPALAAEGVQWAIVPDVHVARACADYPYQANLDQCDPPNRADQQNPAQGYYYAQSISRGVTTKVPVPFGLRPHRAQHVDPSSGAIHAITVVPAANGMSWNEGYGLYGTGEIDAIAARNDAGRPMLVLFAHDGDNAWSGGNTYYTQNVTQFSHLAAAQGYEPTTVAEFLADHPVDPTDVVHVEDGGWVNADGDFGSPQFINWNWPLVNAAGQFDISSGWAEDERNWAVLTAATNVVLTAEGALGAPDPARIAEPLTPGTTDLERAWHFLLAGHESGYMYYGTSLDMEIKATLACNRAVSFATAARGAAPDTVAPTIWLPQRLPWNPGGKGGGALWGWPGGAGAPMDPDFRVWTFAHDVSGIDTCRLVWRLDLDGQNPLASTQNDTYAGGPEVGAWQTSAMARRAFPAGNVFDDPGIQFTVLPTAIAEQWSAHVTGLADALVDYYVESVDRNGRVRRSPIQHVWVGSGGGPPNPAVAWEPANPTAGGTLTIHYDAVPGALPDGTNPVRLHVGHSGWTSIVSPDPAMTWNPATQRFDHVYAIPTTATSVDFVFHDGAGTWDNNAGADWHVAVTGAQSPPHVIDGTLDAGLTPVASCGGRELYADYDGRWLYVAAPRAAAGLDHFVFVARGDSTRLRSAPWAKAGQATAWDLFVANESTNNFAGWFDAAGNQPTAGLQKAAGSVLEAMVDVSLWSGPPPASWRVAFAAYATADGGALSAQVPCGDGDGALEPGERLEVVSSAIVSAPSAWTGGGPRLRLASANPTRGRFRAVVDAAAGEPMRVQVCDVRGAVVATLWDGPAPGALSLSGDLTSRSAPPGVYFVVARGPRGIASTRLVRLR